MKRPLPTIVATVLLVIMSAVNIFAALPFLAQGAEAANATAAIDNPPYFILLLAVFLGILGLVAAVGVWRNQRWGKILAIAVMALGALSALPGIFLAQTTPLFLSALGGVLVPVLIIVLVLWPAPKAQVAQTEIA